LIVMKTSSGQLRQRRRRRPDTALERASQARENVERGDDLVTRFRIPCDALSMHGAPRRDSPSATSADSVDRQRTESASDHRDLMDPRRSDEDTSSAIGSRRQRQQAEILRLLAAQQVSRAADLAHEHLAEFPDDDHLRSSGAAALNASTDPHLQRRSREFVDQ
jgi:hypothetical protein